jgi:hypothetical protein
MADKRAKALSALREGRVAVHAVFWPDEGQRATLVHAVVDGHRGRHQVDLVDGTWWCTCTEPACAHALAVALVTGHATATSGRAPRKELAHA